eukprot:170540_1
MDVSGSFKKCDANSGDFLCAADLQPDLRCECAVVGVFNASDAAQRVYYGLHSLQHRGQESAGILVARRGNIINSADSPTSPSFSEVSLSPKLFQEVVVLTNGCESPSKGGSPKLNGGPKAACDPAGEPVFNFVRNRQNSANDEFHRSPGEMAIHKGFGLVLDVFDDPRLFTEKLIGETAIGHTRYSTAGGVADLANVQPFSVKYRHGNLAVAHNGNITKFKKLHHALSQDGTLFQTSSDSELLLHLIARSHKKSQSEQILDALSYIEGAYCFLVLTDKYMFAARDTSGFRPLQLGRIGERAQKGGATFCLASETCALDLIGAKTLREIEPGELLRLDLKGCRLGGQFTSFQILPKKHQPVAPCVFEFVYFARPDSTVFGQTVDTVRHRTGIELAHEAPVGQKSEKRRLSKEGEDLCHTEPDVVVIPVPDSSNTAALGYMEQMQRNGYHCKFGLGIIRNHYVGRTFISPNQNARELKVRCKFNIVRRVVAGKIVVLVDDSIVRGTTSRQLVRMVREAGAREVHFRVASPPVIGPCFYGMDFPTREELIANRFASVDKIGQQLNVDSLKYLSVEGLMKSVRQGDPRGPGEGKTPADNHVSPYCGACFTGVYPVKPTDW